MLRRILLGLLLGAGGGSLGGCGFKPMPVPDSSGMPPGPGLLTGKKGQWVIVGPRQDPS
jgi:hypothetical protein